MSPVNLQVSEAATFVRQLERVCAAVEKRTTIPMLGQIKIVAGAENATLVGTDLELFVFADVPATVEQSGAVTIAAHRALQVAKAFDADQPVRITGDGTMKCGSATAKLQTLPVDDFPALDPAIQWQTVHLLSASEMRAAFQAVSFAMSTEETRYYLKGCALQWIISPSEGGRFRAVATDGHRLALRYFEAEGDGLAEHDSVIVPRPAVQQIERLCAKAQGDVMLSVNGKWLKVEAQFCEGAVTIVTKLVDGTFPYVDRVIPPTHDDAYHVEAIGAADVVDFWDGVLDRSFSDAESAEQAARENYHGPESATPAWKIVRRHDKIWTVDSAALAKAVKRARAITNGDRYGAVKVTVMGDALLVTAKHPEGGELSDEIACESNVDADPFEVAFNSVYLLDMCARGERLTFRAADSTAPVRITMPGDDAGLYLLMPMRV